MNVMIERIARAQWESRRKHVKSMHPELPDLEEWGDGTVPILNGIENEAKAALEAMRNPTAEMIFMAKESVKDWSEYGIEWIERDGECWLTGYRAMIDEALKGK